MPIASGHRLGRYEVLALIGMGGMGAVYRAKDTLLERRVALKVLQPTALEEESLVADGAARVLREARASARIDHPNAIAIYDVGEVDGVAFLAMELIVGQSLRSFIGKSGVPLAQRIDWLVQIARALDAAHRLDIVHRDVKPENVMVRNDGIIKVLDFGLARFTSNGGDTGYASVATSGEALFGGTPLYMAPEQILGAVIDGRADQFAWGVVAYELLTGELPWNRNVRPSELLAQVLSREVPPPRTKNPEIPEEVDAVVARALKKAAAERLSSMDEVATLLEPYGGFPAMPSGRFEDPHSSSRLSAPRSREASLPPGEQISVVSENAAAPPQADTLERKLTPEVRRGSRLLMGLAFSVAVVAAVLVLRRSSTQAPTQPFATVDAGPSGSRMSSNAEATAAYRAGMQAIRDASLNAATRELDRALQLDPDFAAAHVALALGAYLTSPIDATMRQHLLDSNNQREGLGDRDRLLLQVLQALAASPPDTRQVDRLYGRAVSTFPNDAELQALIGSALSTHESRLAALDKAAAKDPTLALPLLSEARESQPAAALVAFRRCLEISPAATSCLDGLSKLQEREGGCVDVDQLSRRWLSVEPGSPVAYGRLAEALLKAGEPIDTVRHALESKWARLAQDAAAVRLADEAALAILTGDFDSALRFDRQYGEAVQSRAEEYEHFYPALSEMLIDLEIGRKGDAIARGRNYLSRRAAWASDEMFLEPTVGVMALVHAAGGVGKGEFAKFRSSWMERDEARTRQLGESDEKDLLDRWCFAYALAARTPAEAKEALELQPSVASEVRPEDAYLEAAMGHTYLLAGQVAAAIATLTHVRSMCKAIAVVAAIYDTHAAYDLGRALEAAGDPRAACDSYSRLLTRWGAARPASITASLANERVAALQCPH
jgi:serine/threonine-protein kinase